MKSSIIYYSILLIIVISAVSCREDRRWIKGEGNNVTNTRMPSGFKGINLSMDATVEVYRDSVFRVELTGQQNILNVIETYSKGNSLYIGVERFTVIRKHNPITIRVYMPEIENLDVSGSGLISCVGNFNSYRLYTNISGSGDIVYRGSVSRLFSANISGSGSIRNESSAVCSEAIYTISGSGNINAEWLKAIDVDARISGSGDQRIYATGSLKASISGSGDIYYRGSPSINSHISGSGRLIPIY